MISPEAITGEQLVLPIVKGFLKYEPPKVVPIFAEHKCGSWEGEQSNSELIEISEGHICNNPGKYAAIWFIMGTYNSDDIKDSVDEKLLGFDCPFDDSDMLYFCNIEHLISIFEREGLQGADIDGVMPELIVNPQGEIQKEIMISVYEAFGKKTTLDDLNKKICSHGHETLDDFWEREKHQFGF